MAIPSLEQARAAIEEGRAEQQFWEEHNDEYLELHPEKFVAVYRGKVITASEDLQDIIQVLQAKRIDPMKAWIKFITANPQFLLL